jgi:hypothetical protein
MPTTNNNWPTPVATDLVKDGWEAIKDLGDAIDTTLGVYSPVTPGLVKLTTLSFSGVSSQSVNDCFSTTYDNYRIIINSTGTSVDQNLLMRFRVSGADNTTSVYNYSITGLTTTGSGTNASANSATSFLLSQLESTSKYFIGVSLDIIAPFLTREKTGSIIGNGILSAGNIYGFAGGLGYDGTTSFTGFSIFTSSAGNISGSVSVFGYNK